MKNRLYTFLIRWYSAQAKPLPQWLQRVCEQDSELSAECSVEASLTRALSAEPNTDEVVTDATALSARILSALEHEVGEDSLSHSRTEPVALGTLLRVVAVPIAAAAAVAFFLTVGVKTPGGELPNLGSVAVVEATPAGEGTSRLEDAKLKAWKNPLDAEVENVLADAKGAVGFLASAFLPSRIAQDLLQAEHDAS